MCGHFRSHCRLRAQYLRPDAYGHTAMGPLSKRGVSRHSNNGHCHTQCLSIFPLSRHLRQGPTGSESDRTHSPL